MEASYQERAIKSKRKNLEESTPTPNKKKRQTMDPQAQEESDNRMVNDNPNMTMNEGVRLLLRAQRDTERAFREDMREAMEKNSKDLREELGATMIESTKHLEKKIDTAIGDITGVRNQVTNVDKDVSSLRSELDHVKSQLVETNYKMKQYENDRNSSDPRQENFYNKMSTEIDKIITFVSVYNLDIDKDANWVRNTAISFPGITDELKQEIQSARILKQPETKNKDNIRKASYHIVMQSIITRNQLIKLAKHRPSKSKWDLVVLPQYRSGYREMKNDKWLIHQTTQQVAMIEWHEHKLQLRYKHRDSNRSSPKFILSEYLPDRLEDNEQGVRALPQNRIKIFEQGNEAVISQLRSTIIWTKTRPMAMENFSTMISSLLNHEDMKHISDNNAVEAHMTKIIFNSEASARYIFKKYRVDALNLGWDWSIFRARDHEKIKIPTFQTEQHYQDTQMDI